MFYLLHKRRLLALDPDRIYTFCPRCGVLHAVDLSEVFADGDGDLCATNVYCEDAARLFGLRAWRPPKRRNKP